MTQDKGNKLKLKYYLYLYLFGTFRKFSDKRTMRVNDFMKVINKRRENTIGSEKI